MARLLRTFLTRFSSRFSRETETLGIGSFVGSTASLPARNRRIPSRRFLQIPYFHSNWAHRSLDILSRCSNGPECTRIEWFEKRRKPRGDHGRTVRGGLEREEAAVGLEGRWTGGRRKGCKVRGILSRSVNVYNDVRRWCPR